MQPNNNRISDIRLLTQFKQRDKVSQESEMQMRCYFRCVAEIQNEYYEIEFLPYEAILVAIKKGVHIAEGGLIIIPELVISKMYDVVLELCNNTDLFGNLKSYPKVKYKDYVDLKYN